MSIAGLSGIHNAVGAAGSGGGSANYKLVAEKLREWEWMERFIASNPDVKLRWDQHKTFEILKDEHI